MLKPRKYIFTFKMRIEGNLVFRAPLNTFFDMRFSETFDLFKPVLLDHHQGRVNGIQLFFS